MIGQIPADVVARILPATVFGTSYVDPRPTSAPTVDAAATASKVGSLQPGAVIKADSTQKTLELQDALDSIDKLVKALAPAKLATALGAVSVAPVARDEEIGQAATELDTYLKGFQPEIKTLQGDLGKLATFLETVRKVAPDLLDSADHALNLLDIIVAHRADLDAVLTTGTQVAGSTQAFLAKNTKPLVRFLDDASKLVDALYDNRQIGITEVVQIHSIIGSIAQKAVQQGYLHIDANLNGGTLPYYGAGDRPSYGGAQ